MSASLAANPALDFVLETSTPVLELVTTPAHSASIQYPMSNFPAVITKTTSPGIFSKTSSFLALIPTISSSMLDQLENVICDEQVEKKLLGCDHKAVLRCSQDPVSHQCRKHCNGILSCCGRNCSAHCYQCRDSRGMVSSESTHHPHPCEKLLFCGHRCGKNCSQNHECNTECRQSCRQECAHTHCRQACSSPCAPCQEPCTW